MRKHPVFIPKIHISILKNSITVLKPLSTFLKIFVFHVENSIIIAKDFIFLIKSLNTLTKNPVLIIKKS